MSKENLWFNVRVISSNKLKPASDKPVPYITDDGEIAEGLIAKKTTYDSAPFVKLFNGSSVFRASLSSTASRVLDLVLYEIESSQDTSIIQLSTNTLEDFVSAVKEINPSFNMSRKTMTRGIRELIDSGVLLKLRANEYQFNPNLFFNGDRIKAITKELGFRE